MNINTTRRLRFAAAGALLERGPVFGERGRRQLSVGELLAVAAGAERDLRRAGCDLAQLGDGGIDGSAARLGELARVDATDLNDGVEDLVPSSSCLPRRRRKKFSLLPAPCSLIRGRARGG